MMMKLIHTYQQLPADFYQLVEPEAAPEPQLLVFNHNLAQSLRLDDLPPESVLATWFSGQSLPPSASPIAQAYAGHQFGQLNMLGDGRAVLLGEIETPNGRIDVQLKGSGRTPFSRNGDGKANLPPMLREYLMSEAMFALGIPTTRSLAVTTTGEIVRRKGARTGAVLTRTAASHIRVGTFVYAAMLAQRDKTTALLDYTIARHYPALVTSENPVLALLKAVINAQIQLLVHWQRVGFIHGVLNTDNVTLSGETIDYGPCAFMESYDPLTVFSSIDHGGRYAFANQVPITQWNLARFAESLLPVIDENDDKAVELATDAINQFAEKQKAAWQAMMRGKLGLNDTADDNLTTDLLTLMHERQLDYTNTFIGLTELAMGQDDDLPDDEAFTAWLARWQSQLSADSVKQMQRHNPVVIPRNQLVEKALTDGENGDLTAFHDLLAVLQNPYDWQSRATLNKYQQPATAEWTANYQTFCGT